jgi:hypothetical protein
VHVHQREVDILRSYDIDRFFTALGEKSPIADRLEDIAKGLARTGIVVGNEK